MKKILGVLGSIAGFAFVLVAMVIGKTAGRAAVDGYTAQRTENTIEKALVASAEQVRPSLPIQVDAQTQLYDVRVSGTEIVYLQRITGISASDVTQDQLSTFAGQLNTRTCSNATTSKLLNAGGRMTYAYVDGAGQTVGYISLDKASCGGTSSPVVALHAVPANANAPVVASTADARADLAQANAKTQACIEAQKRETAAIDRTLPADQVSAAYDRATQHYMACLKS